LAKEQAVKGGGNVKPPKGKRRPEGPSSIGKSPFNGGKVTLKDSLLKKAHLLLLMDPEEGKFPYGQAQEDFFEKRGSGKGRPEEETLPGEE